MYNYMNAYPTPQPSFASPYQARLNALDKTELIRVNGEEGARAYSMASNSVVPLFDGNEDILYIKTSDGAGFSTIRKFNLVEIAPSEAKPSGDYVTRKEFDELKGMILNVKYPVPEQPDTPDAK